MDQELLSAPKIPNHTENDTVKAGELYSPWRKVLIVFVASWMTLTMTFSSTAIFPATIEIAGEFSTTLGILNASNAMVFIAMGLSSFIWVPISQFTGRKLSYDAAILALFASTLGTACAPNIRVFIATRLLAGLTGTYFMVAGQTMLADIYKPTQRGTATAFFMVGTVCGPAVGPCVGGIVVALANWRVIFWIQAAMAGLGLATSLIFVPSIEQSDQRGGKTPFSINAIKTFTPLPVLKALVYPNVFLVDLSCAFLSYFQYSLLASPRHLINPRFHLTTPLVSGLFYLAPGTGFVVGALLGGRLSDRAVIRGIEKRNGLRLPQDRLNSGLWSFFLMIPASTLLYGWCLELSFGGLALPIVSAFFCGLGLMLAFNSLNTYCAEVLPEQRTDVITTKYLVQYAFGAGGTASIIPLIDRIGIGLTSVICISPRL
ncbi:major facilitator superfamily domain-containing protein [Bisporella sp. PMI_857]|nr:major facilitator superfamily domain-containing protein [Bisporella sp. PMI_857]